MKRLLTCAAAASAVVLATGARAQEAMDRPGPSRFDLGVYAGGSVTSSWFTSRLVTVSGGQVTNETEGESYKPGYAPVFGLQATYWATPELGLETTATIYGLVVVVLSGAAALMRTFATRG